MRSTLSLPASIRPARRASFSGALGVLAMGALAASLTAGSAMAQASSQTPIQAQSQAPSVQTPPGRNPHSQGPQVQKAPADRAVEAPQSRPKLPKDKRTQLEGLFAALKVAPDERSAKQIADRLDQIFSDSGSPAADLLMARAGVAAEAKQYDLALQLLDQVIAIEPDYLGALSKRATLRYIKDEYGAALADIREVLAREPRHFTVLFGLALILRDIGEDKLALEALRRALAVNPNIDGADEMESQLAVKVEGREI